MLAYQVRASTTLMYWGGLGGAMAAVSTVTSAPYRAIVFAVAMAILIGIAALMSYTSWKYRNLAFEDAALVFPHCVIRAEEVKHIFANDKTPVVIVHFRGRRSAISLACDRKVVNDFRSEFRRWAWRNEVTIKTESPLRRAR